MNKKLQILLAAVVIGISFNAHTAPMGAQLPNGVDCLTTELTTSLSCVGVYDPGNDNGQASIFSDATFLNMYGTGWTELSKIEDPSWGTGSLGLMLPTGQGGTSGTWQVNSDAWDGYVQGEILAILKAGTNAAAYEIDLTVTSGIWNISSDGWIADGKASGLSHFSFWTTAAVPEPSVIALFGLGLLGLGFARRRTHS